MKFLPRKAALLMLSLLLATSNGQNSTGNGTDSTGGSAGNGTGTSPSTGGAAGAYPSLVWSQTIGSVEAGNGAFLSPQGNLLAVVSKDATVLGLDPKTGDIKWTFVPGNASVANSFGGATFSNYEGKSYLVYSVVSNVLFEDMTTSRMIALDLGSGTAIFETEEVVGRAKGAPVTTKDGSHIMTTHNVKGETGHFSVFTFGTPAVNFTFSVGNASHPFGAIGYYYDPIEGSFPQGAGNTNDLFMWTADTPLSATAAGDGQMYAFQVPVTNPFNTTPYSVSLVGNVTAFQSPNPPVFASGGYIMYIAASKSEIRYWQGSGLPRDYFQANSNNKASFSRGDPAFASPNAPVVLSSSDTQPIVYGSSAASELFRMTTDLSSSIIHNTSTILTNKVLVSPDDMYVYYGTSFSMLTKLDGSTLDLVWNISTSGPIYGEMAQSLDGAFIYVANSAAQIQCFQVMEKTDSVSIPPSASPSVSGGAVPVPTSGGNVMPTADETSDVPTPGISMESDMPTPEGSVETETDAPVGDAPVPKPVMAPTPRAPSAPTPSAPTSSGHSHIVSMTLMYTMVSAVIVATLVV